MNGYGCHTYSLWNDAGERYWVKFHFKTQQGHQHLTNAEAEAVDRQDPRELPGGALRRDRGRPLPALDAAGPDHARARGREDALQPVRPDQGLAARRLSADRDRRDGAEPQRRRTTSPRSSTRPSARRTWCPASASRPTRCCRRASSPTPTPTATGSAPTTRRCRSTRRRCEVQPLPQGRLDAVLPQRQRQPRRLLRAELVRAARSRTARCRSRRSASPATPSRYNHRIGNDDFSQPRALFNLFDAGQKARLFSNYAAAMGGVPDAIVERQCRLLDQVHPDYGRGVREAVARGRADDAEGDPGDRGHAAARGRVARARAPGGVGASGYPARSGMSPSARHA